MNTDQQRTEQPIIVHLPTGCPPWEHDVSLCGRYVPTKPVQSAPEPSRAATEAYGAQIEAVRLTHRHIGREVAFEVDDWDDYPEPSSITGTLVGLSFWDEGVSLHVDWPERDPETGEECIVSTDFEVELNHVVTLGADA